MKMFHKERFAVYDYVEYSGSSLTITRNPFGFVNARKRAGKEDRDEMAAYDGVVLNA